jgi:8-amino-7-oxononanoate synthase
MRVFERSASLREVGESGRDEQSRRVSMDQLPSHESDFSEYARRRLRLAGYSILGFDNPYFVPLDRLQSELAARGDRLTSFANYDYLGLSGDARINNAACVAVNQFGTGVGGSRLVGGERSIHRALEYELSSFIGVEDVLTMVSGYGANVSLVGHALSRGDLIIVDELSHNSILAGTKLSRATVLTFPHNDCDALEDVLQKRRDQFRRALIIVEGLYSMDGDVPDLPRILELKKRYNAWVMVDEAHSIGVLGRTGRGISEHFNLDPNEIDLIVGTMSKCFVNCGGFIGGRQSVIDWLRFTLPGFVYSVGLSPAIAAAVLQALKIIEIEPERLAQLRENSRYFLSRAAQAGLDTGPAIGIGVVPVLFDTPERTLRVARTLMRAGYYVPPIVQVGVPKDKPRLRFFISAAHRREQIDGVVAALSEAVRPAHWSADEEVDPGFFEKQRLETKVVQLTRPEHEKLTAKRAGPG